jgi:hypothetical protein
LACAIVILSGCTSIAFTSGGHVALDLGQSEFPPEFSFRRPDAQPTVLQRYDALQDSASDAADPNKRSGANCAGGVCTIF